MPTHDHHHHDHDYKCKKELLLTNQVQSFPEHKLRQYLWLWPQAATADFSTLVHESYALVRETVL